MILEALALIGLILFFPIWFFGRNKIKKYYTKHAKFFIFAIAN